jgi:hypothetical protein
MEFPYHQWCGMKVYENEYFDGFHDQTRWPWQLAGHWVDLAFRNCRFAGCKVLSFMNPRRRRPLIRNVRLHNCEMARS